MGTWDGWDAGPPDAGVHPPGAGREKAEQAKLAAEAAVDDALEVVAREMMINPEFLQHALSGALGAILKSLAATVGAWPAEPQAADGAEKGLAAAKAAAKANTNRRG